MIAIDTNLLIYAHRSSLPEHKAALRALEKAYNDPGGWGIPVPCVAEFWSVVTHPAFGGGASSAEQARGFLNALVLEAGAAVWLPLPGFWGRLTQVAAHLQINGARIFDLQIALTAFDHGGTEIWTHDRNFTVMPGMAVRDPL